MSTVSVRRGDAAARRRETTGFAIRDLSVLAYAQGFTLWHYRACAEVLPRVAERGFFDDAVDMLASGDIVMVSSPLGARIMVIAATEGEVAVAPLG